MKKALAFDIGGTKIYSTIIDETGNIIADIDKFSTPKTIDEIKSILKSQIIKHEDKVDIIAIATAGAVNNENTAVIGSTGNLPKGYYTINFSELSNKKVFLENDANAAAWAEYILGSSKGTNVSVMLTLGTGVGGGIIVNNKLLKGKAGAAGEMHFKLSCDKKRKCTCGSWDCFEAYASGTGLKLTAEEMLNDKNVTTYDVHRESMTYSEFLDLNLSGNSKKRLFVYDYFHLGYGNVKTLFKSKTPCFAHFSKS